MTWSIITSAFLLGIASNLHCVGMCGPIALAIPYNSVKTGWFNLKIIRVLLYNFGRISTYALLGLCAGLIGLSIQFIGFLQIASIFSGVLIFLRGNFFYLNCQIFDHSRNFFNLSEYNLEN